MHSSSLTLPNRPPAPGTGMGVIIAVWNLSLFVAPGIGGLLYGRGMFGSEDKFPQLLPNLVSAVFAALGCVLDYARSILLSGVSQICLKCLSV